jgi:hypothetical protein
LEKKLRNFGFSSSPSKSGIFKKRTNEMAARVNSVQHTEIKGKKISLEVIKHIHKPITAGIDDALHSQISC